MKTKPNHQGKGREEKIKFDYDPKYAETPREKKWIGEMTLGGDPHNPFPLKKKYKGYSQKIRKALDKATFDFVSGSPRMGTSLEQEFERYRYRLDTGWDCCVCGEVARVWGDGFTWCLKHWDKFDLGRTSDSKGYYSVARMRDELKKL